jgi:hypothetical protein
MKRRKGFVTNSSSTSFIISCKSIPTSIEEAKEIWFGEHAKYVNEDIIDFLFRNLKEYKIDLKKVIEIAESKTWAHINDYRREEIEFSEEYDFLNEIASSFEFEEIYNDENGYYSSPNKNSFHQWMDKEYKKLKVDGRTLEYKKRKSLENKWFNRKEVRERFIIYVKEHVYSLDNYPVCMQVEVGNEDGEIGSEIEYYFNWERFPGHVRFSHH